jgi:ribosomal protein S18 acetylase RimI-like enzyme
MRIRERGPADRPAVEAFLAERGHLRVARRGELISPLEQPALVADDGRRLAGVLSYVPGGTWWEVLTLHAADRRQGVGSALLDGLERLAAARGCRRLWLVTTNDNVDALRPGAVDDARARLKTGIPTVGDHGIPLRDELELEKPL